MINTRTMRVTFRGIAYDVVLSYDTDDPMRYEHVSIKPAGNNFNFLRKFRLSPEWAMFDNEIDREWNEWIGTREDAMDVVHANIEDEMIDKMISDIDRVLT